MTDKTPFYITTAISYVNGAPHLGHAYEAILTDVMARFKRLDGHAVKFLTGTDEHGEKVAKTAEDNGYTPQDFADLNAGLFRDMCADLGISNDDFIRTTEPRHFSAAQNMWRTLKNNGDIYLGKYEGWYSVREEAYFTEDELQKGDDGNFYTENNTPVKWVEEESYFFKLSAYTDKLLKYFDENPNFIQPESRRNEVISFVKGGLRDLSVSRHKDRLKWGIPVPDDDDHVMYVWLDALTNYITAAGYPDTQSEAYKTFWPANYHVIGKDIIRFHAVYWPAFLMAANLAMPHAIFAHGFINIMGEKMSKSVGNVVSPAALVDTYGLDQIRYFLMRTISHGNDGNFSHDQAVERINADLANGLGNLAQRTLSMIHKNCDGAIPEAGAFTADDDLLLKTTYDHMIPTMRNEMNAFKPNRALESMWRIVSEANAYIDTQAPWTLKKTDTARMKTVLYVLSDVIRCLGIAAAFVMPASADKILNQLEIPKDKRTFAHISAAHALKSGTKIDKPEGVFPRIVADEAAA